jgi:hypothetical protein
MVVVTYYQLPSRAERKQLRALGVSTLVNKCAPIELVRTVHYLLRPLGRFNDPFDMT